MKTNDKEYTALIHKLRGKESAISKYRSKISKLETRVNILEFHLKRFGRQIESILIHPEAKYFYYDKSTNKYKKRANNEKR